MQRTLWTWAVAAVLAAASASAAETKKSSKEKEPAQDAASGSCRGSEDRGMASGPVAVGFFDVDFATGRRACSRTELGLGVQGGAIIDTPDFYGAISGGPVVYGSYALYSTPLEVFGSLEAVKVQYVQNASLKGTAISLGQATVGATYVLNVGPMILGPSMRLMLPLDTSMPDVRTVGVEAGGALSYRPLPALELHAYLGGDLSAGLSSGSALPRPGLLVNAGAQYALTSWFGAVLDVNGHIAEAAYLAPALGLRVGFAKSMGIELAGTLPLLGTIRNDAAVGLRVSYRM